MATYRNKNSFNHHYSDQHGDMGAPVGSIIAVYVDNYSTVNGTIDKDAVAYNYPGYVYCEGQDLNISDFPLLFEAIGNKYGGANPNTVDLTTWNGSKTANTGNSGHTPGGIDLGTFKVPDLRMKRINGSGGIDGSGSLTPDEAAMEVGDTGGEWYISRARQLKEYSFGSVRITGYTSVTGFISGTLSGTADISVGPMEEKFLQGPPPHGHMVLGSEHDTRSIMDAQDTAGVPDQQPGWDTGYGMILESQLPQGDAAGHSHYLAEFRPARNSTNTSMDEPKDQYSYDVSEDYAHEYAAPGNNAAQGQVVYTVQNNQDTTYSWVCPTGVTSVCVLCIGGGSGGMSGTLGGGGGGLAYKNNISVIAGNSYSVQVGHGGTGSTAAPNTDYANVHGGDSFFITQSTCIGKGGGNYGTPATSAMGGGFFGDGGGNGGHGGAYGAGGGCGGYAGDGGGGSTPNADSGSGGSGAGAQCSIAGANNGAGGGGTGLLGIGTTGAGASGGTTTVNTTYTLMSGGAAGSGGQAGENTASPTLNTRNWVPISNLQLSSGAVAVWSQFMLDTAIYPIAPTNFSINDPYLGVTQTGGYVLDITSATTAVTLECACDNEGTFTWLDPNGSVKTSQTFGSSATPPYTPTTTVNITGLVVGQHILTFTVKNTSVAGADTWSDNPAGIGWKITRTSDSLVLLTSRQCTGGAYGYGDAKGGDGGYPGGGGGANYWHSDNAVASDPGDGAHGAVRIIWGPNRSFPSAAADVATGVTDEAVNAYDNPFGSFKHNDTETNENNQTVTYIKSKQMNVTPAQAGIQLNEGTLTMTGAEQLEVSAGIVPRQPVPLVLKYFRVKYLIKAF